MCICLLSCTSMTLSEFVQLLVVMTRGDQDVRRCGPEFPQGLHLSEAVAYMESRQFTRGLQLLDFLDEALRPPSNLKKDKQDVLGSIGRERLHVRFHSFTCPPAIGSCTHLIHGSVRLPLATAVLSVTIGLPQTSSWLVHEEGHSHHHNWEMQLQAPILRIPGLLSAA